MTTKKETTTKDWKKAMAWNAHRQAAIKKAASLSGYLTRAGEAEQAHQGRIAAGQLRAMEQASGLLERAMVLLGCAAELDGIEDDLVNALAWIDENA
jgi:hypothetical protein